MESDTDQFNFIYIASQETMTINSNPEHVQAAITHEDEVTYQLLVTDQ